MKKLMNLLRAWNLQRKLSRMNRHTKFWYFKRECRRARTLAKDTGVRHRVYLFDKYMAVSRGDIIRLKRHGFLDKKSSTGMLAKTVLYDTLTGANTHPQFSNRKV